MTPKRAAPHASINSPWTNTVIPVHALMAALQRGVTIKGERRTLSEAAARSYVVHLRMLIPRAETVDSLALALGSSVRKRGGHEGRASDALIRTRRAAWARFIATMERSAPWSHHAWPALPKVSPRKRNARSATYRWFDARTIGAGLRWLCLRAEARGEHLRAPDFRGCTYANIERRAGGGQALRIDRMAAGARRGKPTVLLPLGDADLLVIGAMLRASWGENVKHVPPMQRLLAAKGDSFLTPANLAQLRMQAGMPGRDVRFFCEDTQASDVIDAICAELGISLLPIGREEIDAWGAALAVVLGRLAIRGRKDRRELDEGMLKRVVDAFRWVERSGMHEMPPEADPVMPEQVAALARMARERFTRRTVTPLPDIEEDGTPVEWVDEPEVDEAPADVPVLTTAPQVDATPIPLAVPPSSERVTTADRMKRIMALRNMPVQGFTEEEMEQSRAAMARDERARRAR